MTINCQYTGHLPLETDIPKTILKLSCTDLNVQLERDKIEQKRKKVIILIALAIIFAVSSGGFTLALTVVPYGIFFTCLLVPSTIGSYSSIFFFYIGTGTKKEWDEIYAFLYKRPVFYDIENILNSQNQSTVTNITKRIDWLYLVKFNENYTKEKTTFFQEKILIHNDLRVLSLIDTYS
jgi:hypothetical protein